MGLAKCIGSPTAMGECMAPDAPEAYRSTFATFADNQNLGPPIIGLAKCIGCPIARDTSGLVRTKFCKNLDFCKMRLWRNRPPPRGTPAKFAENQNLGSHHSRSCKMYRISYSQGPVRTKFSKLGSLRNCAFGAPKPPKGYFAKFEETPNLAPPTMGPEKGYKISYSQELI